MYYYKLDSRDCKNVSDLSAVQYCPQSSGRIRRYVPAVNKNNYNVTDELLKHLHNSIIKKYFHKLCCIDILKRSCFILKIIHFFIICAVQLNKLFVEK